VIACRPLQTFGLINDHCPEVTSFERYYQLSMFYKKTMKIKKLWFKEIIFAVVDNQQLVKPKS